MIRKSAIAIEIISGPDNHSRYTYAIHWYDPNPPYCGICGADPSRNCGHYGPRTRGQVRFGKIKCMNLSPSQKQPRPSEEYPPQQSKKLYPTTIQDCGHGAESTASGSPEKREDALEHQTQ